MVDNSLFNIFRIVTNLDWSGHLNVWSISIKCWSIDCSKCLIRSPSIPLNILSNKILNACSTKCDCRCSIVRTGFFTISILIMNCLMNLMFLTNILISMRQVNLKGLIVTIIMIEDNWLTICLIANELVMLTSILINR